jgi:cytochrome c oxidase subunit 2
MFTNLPFFPHQASAQAAQVDAIYFFMVAVTAFFSLLIAVLVVVFAFKYRRKSDDEVGVAIHGSLALELLWTFIPLAIAMVMFAWGAKVFFDLYRPPAGAMEIFVVGKQWMWKAQHADGQREINELHVPIGRPEAHHGLGRRHLQLLHPGISREGRRHPRPLYRCGSPRPR